MKRTVIILCVFFVAIGFAYCQSGNDFVSAYIRYLGYGNKQGIAEIQNFSDFESDSFVILAVASDNSIVHDVLSQLEPSLKYETGTALSSIKMLKTLGVDLDARFDLGPFEVDALDMAAMSDDPSLLTYLLEEGIEDQGLPCQYFCIFSSSKEVVDLAFKASEDNLGLMPFLSLVEGNDLFLYLINAVLANQDPAFHIDRINGDVSRFDIFKASDPDPLSTLDLASFGIEGSISLLEMALLMNNEEAVEYLMTNGADLNFPGLYGITPFQIACLIDADGSLTERFIDLGAQIDEYCGLLSIAQIPNIFKEIISFAIKNNTDIDLDLSFIDLEKASAQSLECLIAHGLDVDSIISIEGEEMNLVALSILFDNPYALEVLIDNKADLTDSCIEDLRPIDLASIVDVDGNLTDILLSNGVETDEVSFLYSAYSINDILYALDLDALIQDDYDNTAFVPRYSLEGYAEDTLVEVDDFYSEIRPLSYACYMDDLELLNHYISRGFDVNERNEDGISPLMIACGYSKDNATIKVLLENGAKLEARDYDGRTPLFYAVKNNADALQLIIDWGANLKVEDRYGDDLMDWIDYYADSILYTKLYWEIRDAVKY